MSEVSSFAVAVVLPVAAGVYLAKLLASIGKNEELFEKKYHWPTTIEREELLKTTFHKDLVQSGSKLSLPENDSLHDLTECHNQLEDMMRSFESQDIMSVVAEQNHGDLLFEAQSNMRTMKEALTINRPSKNLFEMASKTDILLRKLASETHSTLAEIEREATSDLMTETLQSMGYRLKKKGNTLLGVSGDTSLKARVLSDGSLTLDTTSFSGISCQREVARFENELKKKGVVLRRLLGSQKDRKEGVLLKDPLPAPKTPQGNVSENKGVSQQTDHGLNQQEQYYYLKNRSLQRLKVKGA